MSVPDLGTSIRDRKLTKGSATKVGVKIISMSGVMSMDLGIGYKEIVERLKHWFEVARLVSLSHGTRHTKAVIDHK